MDSNVKTGLFCCVLPILVSIFGYILLLGLFLFIISRAGGPCSGLKGRVIDAVFLTGKKQDIKTAICDFANKLFGDGNAMGEYAYNEEWDCGIKEKDYSFESATEGPDNTVEYKLKGKTYVFKDGTRAWRNNNPGNIRKSSKEIGNVGGYAVFSNYAAGSAEIKSLLQSERYSNLSIKEAIFKYAPPSENDSTKYAETVKKSSGLDINRKINELSDTEIDSVINAIKTVEGYKGGQVIIKNEDGSVDTKQCIAKNIDQPLLGKPGNNNSCPLETGTPVAQYDGGGGPWNIYKPVQDKLSLVKIDPTKVSLVGGLSTRKYINSSVNQKLEEASAICGNCFSVNSAYRNCPHQIYTCAHTTNRCAAAGASNHQGGQGIDINGTGEYTCNSARCSDKLVRLLQSVGLQHIFSCRVRSGAYWTGDDCVHFSLNGR